MRKKSERSQGCRKESREMWSEICLWNGWVNWLWSHDNISRLVYFADLFPSSGFIFRSHTYATAPLVGLKWWEHFPIFFITTLLNKTPSSDVWFQCCFFLSSVQFVLAHRPQKKKRCGAKTSARSQREKSVNQKFNGLNI